MRSRRLPYPEWMLSEIVDKSIIQDLSQYPQTSKILFRCPICNTEYYQTIHNHINSDNTPKQGCPTCSKKKSAEKYSKKCSENRSYPQWFIEELFREDDKQRAIDKVLKADDKVDFVCCECGNIYKQRVASHIKLSTGEKKKGCPKCGIDKQIKSSRKTKGVINQYPQWFIDDLYLEKDKELAKNITFYGAEEKQFFCKKHNLVYTQKVRQHIDLKTHTPKAGCPQCSIDKMRNTLGTDKPLPTWFIDDLVKEDDKTRALKGEVNSNETLEFMCEHNHIYNQDVHAHITLGTQEKKCGCPICAKIRSKVELEIEDYINSLGFFTEHKRFSKTLIGKMELDIYIPDKKIAIEYNGSYWHKTLPYDLNSKMKMYHNKKYYSCKDLGIRLISIFDVDWEYRKDKIKQYLKDLLLPVEHRLYARKCIIKNITKEESNSMYEEYHLLGKTTVQSISYGLYYNNELLSCMSFQKGRYKENKTPVWTLTRFVTKSGYSIVGGASKLLRQFERDYNPEVLLSYSDNDYFSGGLYSNLGFECLGDTNSPRYYWYLNNKEFKRESCQLRHLSKQYPNLYQESLSINGNREDYIMLKLKAIKVYRSGNIKWIKKYP